MYRKALGIAAVVALASAAVATTAGASGPAGSAQVFQRQLIVTGTNHADKIALVVPAADTVQVDFGDDGTAEFTVALADFDRIAVRSLDGDDSVRINYGAQTQPATTIDTGKGNDFVSGGSGAELIRTGDGSDFVDGNRGNDVAELGDREDAFVWDPGDGSDTIQGGRGKDTMLFNGAAGAEKFAAVANGNRLRFTRDLGNIVMDTDDVERVSLKALGGADSTVVGDLGATDVRTVEVDHGPADGATDLTTVEGTNGRDFVAVSGNPTRVNVAGLKARVSITGHEAADQLTIDTKTGTDTVTATLADNTIGFSVL